MGQDKSGQITIVQTLWQLEHVHNVSMGKWQFLGQTGHECLPYSKNLYITATILRALRLKFSIMYHLDIRCSFKQALNFPSARNSRFLYTSFHCIISE